MKTTSERRRNASSANGALSKGPKTDEGKAKSSLNAIRHGMLAESILLTNEEERVFKELYFAFMDRFQPADEVERGFVEEMIVCHWRLRRAWLTETELWNRTMEHQPDGPAHHPELGRISLAFTDLAKTPEFALLSRYEVRLHRMSQRALKCLLELRAHKPAPADAAVQPKPEPAPAPEPAVENKPVATPDRPKLQICQTNLIPKSNTPQPRIRDLDPEILERLSPGLK